MSDYQQVTGKVHKSGRTEVVCAHGQLYVECSRVGNANNLFLLQQDESTKILELSN
jgi:hypothetical protein